MGGASNEIKVFTVPSRPKTGEKVTFVVWTSDTPRKVRSEILVNKRKVKACNDSVCMYRGGPFPAGTVLSWPKTPIRHAALSCDSLMGLAGTPGTRFGPYLGLASASRRDSWDSFLQIPLCHNR